jgi:hypothetical protein
LRVREKTEANEDHDGSRRSGDPSRQAVLLFFRGETQERNIFARLIEG